MGSKTRTDAVRDAYAAHFGPLFDSDASLHGNHQVLRFWARRPPIVYATLGARPAEVTLASVVPFPELKEAVSELAVDARKLAPLEILPYRIERTPFEGVLIAPPEDGTLVVRGPGKRPIHAYRAVPLTASELGLGLDAPERLLHLLRDAGALVADPTRDCVLEPDQTRRYWRSARPELLARERRRLRASRVRLSFFHDSGAPPLYLDLEERLISVRQALIEHVERTGTADDLAAARALCAETIFPDLADIGTKPFLAFIDPPTLDAIRLFLGLVVLTHPDARPLLSRTLDVEPEPWSPDFAVTSIAGLLVELYPHVRQEDIVARAREALAKAAAKLAPGDPGSPEAHAWSRLCEAAYRSVQGDRGPQETGVGHCIASTARAATLLEPHADEADPPDERLGKICQRLGLEVFHRLESKPKGYVEH